MKKLNRPISLNSSIKISIKNSINKDVKKTDIVYAQGKEDDSQNKKCFYSAYQYMNTKLKENKKQKSYKFEFSSSQVTERNRSKFSNMRLSQDDKNTVREKKMSIIQLYRYFSFHKQKQIS